MNQKINRYDLLPERGLQEVHRIFNEKLEKYKRDEWKQGLEWTSVLSSLKKHLAQFECGNDYTQSQCLEMAEVAANALILCEFYHTHPQGDNRILSPVNKPIVGVDLDNVIFDFDTAYFTKFQQKLSPYWSAGYDLMDNLKYVTEDKEFWVDMPVLHRPKFEVDYYVTARSIPQEWIMESLQKNNLPCAPILQVPWNVSKLPLIEEHGITLMIDDKYENYKEITNAGIFCYLMDAAHNQYYNVGHRRIYNLDLPIK